MRIALLVTAAILCSCSINRTASLEQLYGDWSIDNRPEIYYLLTLNRDGTYSAYIEESSLSGEIHKLNYRGSYSYEKLSQKLILEDFGGKKNRAQLVVQAVNNSNYPFVIVYADQQYLYKVPK